MVELPVYFRVGDGEEFQVGTIAADSADEMGQAMADFLRAVANAVHQDSA
jgi:hypothetical protein